jgi:polysaccharide export outer membrane protein
MTDMSIRTFLAITCITIISVAIRADAQESARPDASYTILPGDVLQVSVWKEPDLQLELLVRPDGAISFPLAGEIKTRNRTVSELQAELTTRLARFINEPVVTVSVKEVLGNKVYVIGQVNDYPDSTSNRWCSERAFFQLQRGPARTKPATECNAEKW